MTQNSADAVNIALGRHATQSTRSRWSTVEGAGAAVNGTMPADFAIHTDLEDQPWWQLDLGEPWPLDRIVIHNRQNEAYAGRARSLQAEVSLDGRTWTLIHAGIRYFGGGAQGAPLVLALQGRVLGRYLRLSLRERQYLHLAQVEVFAPPAALRLHQIWQAQGFDMAATLGKTDALDHAPPYTVKTAAGVGPDAALTGLRLERLGRFGNNLQQVTNAIGLAQRMGLTQVQVIDFEGFRLTEPAEVGGITLLPPAAPMPPGACFLSGSFFYPQHFGTALAGFGWADRRALVQDALLPLMDLGPPPPAPGATELAIHIRSGDLFSARPHPAYVQPPLSYYTGIVESLRAAGQITAVCLVAEDRKNPCIAGLEQYLAERAIPCRTQSGTLKEDILTLAQARHLVFGFGSFGLGICLIAGDVSSVHAFNEKSYGQFPNIAQVTVLSDAAQGYIRRGDWRASPDQLQLMLDYPVENLAREVLR